jgi:pimeloyl-ACP methyl ester carboxylesterase
MVPSEDQELAVWEWAGDGPTILFAHATGFHGRCWDRIIRMFPDRHCLAVDARGHGRSSKPDPPCHWRTFGRDLAAIAEHWNLGAAIGVGHSMGGHVTTQVAALRPETYKALLLVDPTIFPLEYYGTPPPDAQFTLRRRNVWKSKEEMFERFRHRAPFAKWQPEILRDYCEYGLLPNNGEFILACPPAVEASIYLNSKEPASNIDAEVTTVQQPVVVMRAARTREAYDFDLSASPTAPDLASRFARGLDLVLEGASHYIAMETPERVAEEIRRVSAM